MGTKQNARFKRGVERFETFFYYNINCTVFTASLPSRQEANARSNVAQNLLYHDDDMNSPNIYLQDRQSTLCVRLHIFVTVVDHGQFSLMRERCSEISPK